MIALNIEKLWSKCFQTEFWLSELFEIIVTEFSERTDGIKIIIFNDETFD